MIQVSDENGSPSHYDKATLTTSATQSEDAGGDQSALTYYRSLTVRPAFQWRVRRMNCVIGIVL